VILKGSIGSPLAYAVSLCQKKTANKILASKYKLVIPSEQELIEEIEREKHFIELENENEENSNS